MGMADACDVRVGVPRARWRPRDAPHRTTQRPDGSGRTSRDSDRDREAGYLILGTRITTKSKTGSACAYEMAYTVRSSGSQSHRRPTVPASHPGAGNPFEQRVNR